MYKIEFSKQSQKGAKNLQSAKLTKKAQEYEILAENLRGLYSRRLNIQHRFVYEVSDGPVEIDSVKYDGIVKVIRM